MMSNKEYICFHLETVDGWVTRQTDGGYTINIGNDDYGIGDTFDDTSTLVSLGLELIRISNLLESPNMISDHVLKFARETNESLNKEINRLNEKLYEKDKTIRDFERFKNRVIGSLKE